MNEELFEKEKEKNKNKVLAILLLTTVMSDVSANAFLSNFNKEYNLPYVDDN
jgi:hypothetical protein